jgi:hypothetical protein
MIRTDGTPTIANANMSRKPEHPRVKPQYARDLAAARLAIMTHRPQGYSGYATWPDPVGRAAGAYDSSDDSNLTRCAGDCDDILDVTDAFSFEDEGGFYCETCYLDARELRRHDA